MNVVGIVRVVVAVGLAMGLSQVAEAASWAMLNVTVEAKDAPRVLAAADKLMSSKVGKEFPGKLLLQTIVANGADPATHAFVPIYKTVAEREAYLQKLQADAAWTEFLNTTSSISQPASQVMYRTVKSWGDRAESDHVWMAHAFAVSDPAAFLAALDGLMASPTGTGFPGQVYLSEVVAGGLSPVTHVISVGYANEAEMEGWTATRDASADWTSYLSASRKAAGYLGATMSRDIKSWGPLTLKDLGQ